MSGNHQAGQWTDFLEQRYKRYAQPGFIADDPVSIPHRFTRKTDIEVSGFLTATISWGNRKAILKGAAGLMQRMDNAPGDFILNAVDADFRNLEGFVYRTFQTTDVLYFCRALQRFLLQYGGLEKVFTGGFNSDEEFGMVDAIAHFRKMFFDDEWVPPRTLKHVSDVTRGAAAKRINMFLRWMVRTDPEGIDFGLWHLPASSLLCPLDVHSGAVARRIGILTRKQNDLKAVKELTSNLRMIDPVDPVRFDFALFGEGVTGGR
ncbi:MAG TPA: TIGR02757 family protein [Bacteroidales bacterium]|nr:MAG: TIGR02757 family protein [Bacteroidetes bacterium GWE2_42_24]OFY31846.1 MAG: TIGR02757 family protein [Bacteroidetes bacterium GWF2_43_11]HAQ65414.1 TIGR02757 family protein [Bacteroidales bacterium]HBZ66483.1 TIGR02757 family protein [Bacteroidales bacterium]